MATLSLNILFFIFIIFRIYQYNIMNFPVMIAMIFIIPQDIIYRHDNIYHHNGQNSE